MSGGNACRRATLLGSKQARAVVADRLRNVDAALSRIAASHGTESIGAAATAIGVIRRHLERQFREQAGLGVKQAARITRIQSVLGMMQSRPLLSGGRSPRASVTATRRT